MKIMQHCSTCLSSNRSCVKFSDRPEFWEVLNLLNVNLSIATGFMCWECECIFKRITRFRNQILQAQETIRNYSKLLQNSVSGKVNLKEIIKKEKIRTAYFKTNFENINKNRHLNNLKCCQLSRVTKKTYDKIYIEEEKQNETEYVIITADDQDQSEINDVEYFEVDFPNNWDSDEVGVTNEEGVEKNENSTDMIDEKVTLKNETTEKGNNEKPPYDYKVVNDLKLTKDEQMFNVNKMTMQEMFETRDMDRKGTRYKSSPFKCIKCTTGYFEENKLKQHLRLHDKGLNNNKNLQKCYICELWLRRGEHYNTHYDRHFRRYTCKSCDFTHHKLNRLRHHQLKEHNAGGVYPCKLCNETFDLPRSLRYHNETAHREKPKCDICGKVVSTKSNLKIHMLVHSGAPRASCAVCGRRVRASCLRAHGRTHAPRAPDAPYCIECDVAYKSRAAYDQHLRLSRRHGREDTLKHACSQCPSKFVSKYALKHHVAAKHLKAHPFKCDICGKTFMRKYRLTGHIKEKHEGETKIKDKICGYCGKAFHTNALLKNHIRIHTGERPFACAHCPATFAQKSTMQTHAKALHKNVVNT